MNAMAELLPVVSRAAACGLLALSRATYYRALSPRPAPVPRPPSPRALSADEQVAVVSALHEPRFIDVAPAEVVATLLDEDRYLCSECTMYRILAARREVCERRDQLRHPNYAIPQLLAGVCLPRRTPSNRVRSRSGRTRQGMIASCGRVVS